MKTGKLTQVLIKKTSDETKLICLSAWLLKMSQLGAKLIKFCCKGEHSQVVIKIS